MKVLDLIDEIVEEIENSRKALFASKKTIEVDYVLDILDEIKAALPADIAYAQEVLNRENRIIGEAQKSAAGIVETAQRKITDKVEDHQVTRLAYEKSNRIVEAAKKQAHELRISSTNYAVEVLDELTDYMNEYVEIISENKSNFISKKNKDQAEF